MDLFHDLFPENRPFWAAAREGHLLLPSCASCGRSHWYPRAICPHCLGGDLQWREASGRGVIYAVTAGPADAPQGALAYVTLDGGPTLMTRIVDADPATLAVGQPVRVTFRPTEGRLPVPLFTPA